MFKNTLFIKIVLVFTLPALGMLYFSTVLVYEKIMILKELNRAKTHIQYFTVTENLLHSVQKERGYSSTYITSKKYKNELITQREKTNVEFKNFVKFIS